MYLHRSNQTKLLRRKGSSTCKYCGTPIEWFDRYDALTIPLTPEFPSRRIPAALRWHVNRGVAYPGTDTDTGYCRIPHPSVCPAADHPDLPSELQEVVLVLAVRMRTLIEQGEFVPYTESPSEEEVSGPDPDETEGARHVISYHGALRIAPCEIDQLQCVATDSKTRLRCENGVFDLGEGHWDVVAVPYVPGRQGQSILSVTGGQMWAWAIPDFNVLRRWWVQRCHDHYASPQPDHVKNELVLFNPLRHGDFILTEKPDGYERPKPEGGVVVHDGPGKRTTCATPDCSNATLASVPHGWLCWRCDKLEKRREQVRRRWQQPGDGDAVR
ncbi:DUF6083 domain-containing protein [Streptomyces sp. NBC_00316]|uniref:DUF6083 domain-containing protein n=1 Tax=Streptomyces sp. NBC_00316 TaxID=2975710 RepID=UPI002E2E749E|nr:DUF6083 domain-containing protein [Streptomyces sp. NBC_00316]